MDGIKVAVIDDEPDIVEVLRYNLSKEGYSVVCGVSGEEALRIAREENPQAMVLDLMLPGLNGLEVCRFLKGDPETAGIMILILSAKGAEEDVVKGLELGADDYVAKPFATKVLLARLKNLLRRNQTKVPDPTDILERDGIRIDPKRFEVRIDDAPVTLTSTEFKILQLLLRKPGWVFTRSKIVDEVHGEDYPVTDRSIDVQIVNLRRKLNNHGSKIETVRGVGYRFTEKSE